MKRDLRVLSAPPTHRRTRLPYLSRHGYYTSAKKSGSPPLRPYEAASASTSARTDLPPASLSPFVVVRYHPMLGDNDGVKFVPITFGSVF